ncbi:unnamed protein product [Malus baccata var. baccata]
MKSITTALPRRHENSNIRVFRVLGHMSCSDLYDFIGRVVKHRVEELSLEIWPRDNCEIPYCLIECDSLRASPPLWIARGTGTRKGPEARWTTLQPWRARVSVGARAQGGAKHFIFFLCQPEGLQPNFHLIARGKSSKGGVALRSLKLETGALQYRCIGRPILLKLSSKSGLCSLHSLSLTGVHFSDSALDDVDLFTSSSFPSIERLTVEYCKNMSHDLIVRSPNLKDVQISGIVINSLDINGTRLENLKIQYCRAIRLDNVVSWIKIFALNLRLLDWEVNKITEKILIDIFPLLTIEGRTGLGFKGMACTSLKKCEIPGIACLLKSSPVVHTLMLELCILQRWNNPLLDNTRCTEDQYLQNQVQGSNAFLCHLKVVKPYTNFSVFYSTINIVRFLFEQGRSLQDMIFCCSVKPLSFWLNEIRRIEGFPRASTEVKISVAS